MSDQTIVFDFSRSRRMALVLYGLAKTDIVALTVDLADQGIVVPAQFGKEGLLTLHYSLHFAAPPISDLRVDMVGVLATLSFDQVIHETLVPWTAVRQIDFAPRIYELAGVEELDKIAAEHLSGLRPLLVPPPPDKPRLRRITQLDVFAPAEDEAEIDPAATSREFARSGLRAV